MSDESCEKNLWVGIPKGKTVVQCVGTEFGDDIRGKAFYIESWLKDASSCGLLCCG